jgi:hypothetical protein
VVDYERRLAKGFPSYPWVEQDLVRTFLNYAIDEETDLCTCMQQRRIIAVGLAAIDEGTPLPLYESEDKVIAKVATLFGTLGQLGFTRERIEECLRAVKTLDYEEALDWVRPETGSQDPALTPGFSCFSTAKLRSYTARVRSSQLYPSPRASLQRRLNRITPRPPRPLQLLRPLRRLP